MERVEEREVAVVRRGGRARCILYYCTLLLYSTAVLYCTLVLYSTADSIVVHRYNLLCVLCVLCGLMYGRCMAFACESKGMGRAAESVQYKEMKHSTAQHSTARHTTQRQRVHYITLHYITLHSTLHTNIFVSVRRPSSYGNFHFFLILSGRYTFR